MQAHRPIALLAVSLFCAALLCAQGLTTTATKDDWEEINFEFNSAILSDGYPSLLRLAELLKANPDYRVRLEGNTDSVGSDRYNDRLSRRRAEAVRDFLVKYGAAAGQITIEARGKRDPKVDNRTREGRFINRRVTMTVTDGQGRVVSAGGVGEAIRAMQALEKKQAECCQEVLKRLDKLDEILAALKELKAENDKLKQDVAALQQAQSGIQKQVAELPKPPERAELQQMMTATATDAINRAKPPRFALLGLNIGPTLADTFRPGFDRDIKMSNAGNITFTGKGRYFAPFGRTETMAVQAEAEYLFFPGRQEGQFDIGLVNRWKKMQLGLFNSMKHVHISDLGAGGTLGQGVLTADYLFKYGRVGVFGTKSYLSDRVLARTPVQTASGLVNFNAFDETILRAVDQVGGATSLGLWKDAYLDANFGALFRKGGENRPGGMVRLVQPLNSMWAFTVEAGLNPTYVGPTNDGRIVFGLQLGNWLSPKQYTAVEHAVPMEIPRVRYELLTRRVRTGNGAPVADAGPDQIGVAAGTITLDGSGSFDPDGDTLTFQWTQIAGPSVTLSSPTSATTSFTAEAGQSYAFRLTVKDPQGAQSTARVNVTTRGGQAQPAIVSFQANPTTIAPGQAAVLIWQTQNADQVTISSIGEVAQSGSTSVSPSETTTYTLTATNPEGQTTATVTITVTGPVPGQLPVVAAFTANPPQIPAGGASTLSWQTQNADQVTISGIGPVATSGSASVSPAQTTTYTLIATNSAGQTTAVVTVTVTSPQPARILSFTGTPTTITAGETVLLSWQTEGAVSASISPGVGAVAVNGSVQVQPAATTTYTLTVRGGNGQTATATVTITVNPAQRPPVANAGPNRIVEVMQVPLNAGASTDPNGLPLTFSWVADNPGVTLINPNTATPIALLPNQDGPYTFTVTVTNSQGLSSSASVTITLIRPAVTP
ncbi:MAG: PKD domain-containing protein [Rhodospirillales bacterium]